MSIPKSFGAVELAKYCQVSRNTIHNWIRDGKLKAFKLTGGHYRVEKKELLKFLQHYEMPVPDELLAEEPKGKILLINKDADVLENMKETVMNVSDNIEVEVATTSMEACIKAGTFLPHLIILELAKEDNFTVCKEIKKNEMTAGARLVVVGEAGDGDALKEIGADKVLTKSIEAKGLEKEAKKILP